MPVVPVQVNSCIQTLALLDTASNSSFCSKRLMKQLGIRGRVAALGLSTLNQVVTSRSEVVDLDISNPEGEMLRMTNVYVVPDIPVECGGVDSSLYGHLRGLDLSPGFHPGFFNWGGGGGGSSISATVQPPTLHDVGGGGGDYVSTGLIGLVGSARLVLQFMAVR